MATSGKPKTTIKYWYITAIWVPDTTELSGLMKFHQQILLINLYLTLFFKGSKFKIVIFAFPKSENQVLFWLQSLVIITILTLLIYTPALLTSGTRALYTNLNDPNDLGLRLYPILLEGISVITNIEQKSYVLLIGLFIVLLIFRKKISQVSKYLGLLLALQILSLIIFTLALNSYLPERAYIYLNLCFYLTLASVLWDLLEDKKPWLLAIVSLLILNTVFNFHHSWLSRYKRHVLDKNYYSKAESGASQLNKLIHQPVSVKYSDFQCMIFATYYLEKNKTMIPTSNITSQEFFIHNEILSPDTYKRTNLESGLDIYLYSKIKK